MGDMLREIWESHRELQAIIPPKGRTPYDIEDTKERIQFMKDMELALRAELQEMLDEVSWKPWATAEFFNEDAVQGELIDAFHFFLNLCMLAQMSPDQFFAAYMKKNQINRDRHVDGTYDGLNKCPGCKRAMDDPAVTCYYLDVEVLLPNPPTAAWCKVLGKKVSIPRR